MDTKSDDDILRSLDQDIAASLPSGWRCEPHRERPQHWYLTKTEIDAGEWPHQDYELFYAADQRHFVVTWGNSDAGAFYVEKTLKNATIFHIDALRIFTLEEILRRVMAAHEPNRWGLT